MPSAAATPTSTDDALQRLLDAVEGELDTAIALRHALHADPELAHEEHRTAQRVLSALGDRGDRVAGTGVLHEVDGRGPAIVVRAELDALPLHERTGASYSAKGAAMHACGHDVHAAALVAVCRAAERERDILPAPLLALFQPSEEAYPSGAQMVVQEGRLAGRARAIVGAHVHPSVPWGALAADDGPINAASDLLEIELRGTGGHGAYPHLAADPVVALAALVVDLQTLVSRRIDPMHPAALSIGHLRAGDAQNVIPGVATARATLRTLHREDRDILRAAARRMVQSIATAHGCDGSLHIVEGEPPLDNDGKIVARLRSLLPAAGLTTCAPMRSCGSDDFAFFGAVAPLAMVFVGLDGAPGFRPHPLHHASFLPPDQAVRAVARALVLAYMAAATSLPAAMSSERDSPSTGSPSR